MNRDRLLPFAVLVLCLFLLLVLCAPNDRDRYNTTPTHPEQVTP